LLFRRFQIALSVFESPKVTKGYSFHAIFNLPR
jgi:hypothetical protein